MKTLLAVLCLATAAHAGDRMRLIVAPPAANPYADANAQSATGWTDNGTTSTTAHNVSISVAGKTLCLEAGANDWCANTSSGSLLFKVGATTALTFDTSGNATFVGTITATGAINSIFDRPVLQGPSNSYSLQIKDSTNNKITYISNVNDQIVIANNATTTTLTIASSGAVTAAGMNTTSSFTDDSANTGNRTVNKVCGINAFAASATAITVTNSFVTTTSVMTCTIQTNDTTATLKNCTPASGSFTATITAAATATTKLGWCVNTP